MVLSVSNTTFSRRYPSHWTVSRVSRSAGTRIGSGPRSSAKRARRRSRHGSKPAMSAMSSGSSWPVAISQVIHWNHGE